MSQRDNEGGVGVHLRLVILWDEVLWQDFQMTQKNGNV